MFFDIFGGATVVLPDNVECKVIDGDESEKSTELDCVRRCERAEALYLDEFSEKTRRNSRRSFSSLD